VSTDQSKRDSITKAAKDASQPLLESSKPGAKPTGEKQQTANESRILKNPQWWQAWAAVVLVPVGIYALWVYRGQLDEMRKSTQAATDAAKVAKDSITFAKETAHLDQRAWLTIRSATMKTPLAVGQRPVIEVRVENTGRTPALNTESAGAILSYESIRPGTLPSRDRPFVGEASRSIIGPGAGETSIFYATEPIRDEAQIQGIREEGWVIYVAGSVRYDDIFGNHHRTTFCYGLSGKEADHLRLSGCLEGNTAD